MVGCVYKIVCVNFETVLSKGCIGNIGVGVDSLIDIKLLRDFRKLDRSQGSKKGTLCSSESHIR